ncbi:asparagine synthetase B [Salmonella enterica subsp. arizonae]|nr:asparagine synthetase B [Salmonella enterica subsp. arizonae]
MASERAVFGRCGYSWIDTLKEVAAKQISDQQLETARFRFPYNTPSSKEAYLYREIFEELFPVPSAAECVPGGPSVACSSAKAIEWMKHSKRWMTRQGARSACISRHTSK